MHRSDRSAERPEESVRDAERAADRRLLDLLLLEWSGPWTEAEVARELGSEVEVRDSLARLVGSGLVHRLDQFVFASRSAARAAELESA